MQARALVFQVTAWVCRDTNGSTSRRSPAIQSLGGGLRARARARVSACVCGLGATVVVCGESDQRVVGLCEALGPTV